MQGAMLRKTLLARQNAKKTVSPITVARLRSECSRAGRRRPRPSHRNSRQPPAHTLLRSVDLAAVRITSNWWEVDGENAKFIAASARCAVTS